MRGKKARYLTALLSFLCASTFLSSAFLAPDALAAETRTFNIDAEPLSRALVTLATQADISIGLAGVDLANKTSRELVGPATVAAALERILEGSGLAFDMVDPQTYRIYPMPLARETAAPQELRQRAAVVPLTLPLVEEITVTASKRPVSLQRVPLSVAVVTSTRLSDFGLYSPSDAASLAAAVSTSNQGAGKEKMFVRGLSDGAFTGNTQAAVGVYIDETRATFNSPDPNLQLFDVERVEIIRGPQGTLYGAGPIGGLMRIITKLPVFGDFESEAIVDGSLAGSTGTSGFVEGMLNVPLISDKMAVRAVAYARHDGGYINDTNIGINNANITETTGGRVTTRLRLSQDWLVRAGIVYQSIRAKDTQYYDEAMPKFTRGNLVREPNQNRFLDANFAIVGDLGWADLTSSTAWLSQDVRGNFDASLALPILTNLPIEATTFAQEASYETVNHETRLVSTPGTRFEWLAGVFFSRRYANSTIRLRFLNEHPAPPGAPPPQVPGQPLLLDGIFYSKSRRDTGSEYAAFGEGTFALTPKISLTAGLRVYRGVLNASANNSELIDVGPSEAVGFNAKNGFTPKASVSYKLDASTLLYAEAAQGFRLGGINIDSRVSTPTRRRNTTLTVSNFDSDRLWNFQAGVKSLVLGQSFMVNASAFYAVWSNMQADLTRLNGMSFTANIGRVRNPGFEVETIFAPTDHFTVMTNLSWSNPKLDENSALAAAISANRLPVVPKFSGTMAAQYEYPISADLSGFANLKGDFVGPARLTNGITTEGGAQSYLSLNTRIGVERGRLRVALYVNNVLDQSSNTYAFGNPFSLGHITQVTPLRPRTIGVNLRWTN